jgi:SAM-dependent methyltransferase
MERRDWSRTAHAGIDFMGPYGGDSLERLFEGISVPARARVLDLGCGKGAVLGWLAERAPIQGRGIDLVAAGRELPGVDFEVADAAALGTGDGSYDLVCSVGAVSPLTDLAQWARPGGLVLLGDGYWRRAPTAEYLAALGATRDQMSDLDTISRSGAPLGLELLATVASSDEDWAAYEGAWAGNGELYAAEHPGEAGLDEFVAWIRNGRRRYLELGGRETLGFVLLLFRRT